MSHGLISESWGVAEAAKFLRVHPETVYDLARRGEIPARKIGRAWVFLPDEMIDYLKKKACPSTDDPARRIGGSVYPSLAERLAAQLERMTERKPRSSSSASVNDSGAFADSKIEAPPSGRKRRPVT